MTDTTTAPLVQRERMALLLDIFGPAGLAGLVERFVTTVTDDMAAITEAQAANDIGRVVRSAHRIAGGAANLGLIALQDCAVALERAPSPEGAAKLEALAAESLRAIRD